MKKTDILSVYIKIHSIVNQVQMAPPPAHKPLGSSKTEPSSARPLNLTQDHPGSAAAVDLQTQTFILRQINIARCLTETVHSFNHALYMVKGPFKT